MTNKELVIGDKVRLKEMTVKAIDGDSITCEYMNDKNDIRTIKVDKQYLNKGSVIKGLQYL